MKLFALFLLASIPLSTVAETLNTPQSPTQLPIQEQQIKLTQENQAQLTPPQTLNPQSMLQKRLDYQFEMTKRYMAMDQQQAEAYAKRFVQQQNQQRNALKQMLMQAEQQRNYVLDRLQKQNEHIMNSFLKRQSQQDAKP